MPTGDFTRAFLLHSYQHPFLVLIAVQWSGVRVLVLVHRVLYLSSVMCADLYTMTERLKSGYYSCVRLFIADMRRIFTNCKMYNEKNTDYYRCAIALEKFFVGKMRDASIWMELTWNYISLFSYCLHLLLNPFLLVKHSLYITWHKLWYAVPSLLCNLLAVCHVNCNSYTQLPVSHGQRLRLATQDYVQTLQNSNQDTNLSKVIDYTNYCQVVHHVRCLWQ